MLKGFTAAGLLLTAVIFTTYASAQEAEPTTETAATPVAADQEHDIGTLQAELAKVESERQRLADQLAANAPSESVQQLQQENQALRNSNQAARLNAQAALVQQRQRWFLVGGLTVAVSLCLGFMLAKIGRRKRNEWLN